MYFLVHGSIRILSTNGTLITSLSDGSYFGEGALLEDSKRTADVVSETYCELYKLEKNSFDQVLDHHPQLKLEIQATAKKRRLSHD